MLGIQRVKIRSYEKGLVFRAGEFRGILDAGRHWLFGAVRVDVVSQRDVWLWHDELDEIVRSGALEGHATVLDLQDFERALVWIDGRFEAVLGGGQFALWTGVRKVRTEIADARNVRFDHADLAVILQDPGARKALDVVVVPEGRAGVLFQAGRYVQTLQPGRYAFWRGADEVKVYPVDLRQQVLDVSGQEIMTADKVTLRVNAVAVFRVTDARQAVTVAEDARQALYREAQLVLRAAIGTRELDELLAQKDAVADELEALLAERAKGLGLEVQALGIRDVILPGEMKDLMNRVTEARKAAEANLIARREETAAMRSQANTAKLLESNPALMRLRELEVLEKIAGQSKLSVVLGEKGLADRVVNLL